MAKRPKVILIDDLDGGEAVGTVKFAIDGEAYEIDLSAAHQKELRDALDKFREAGTRLGRYHIGATRTSTRGVTKPARRQPADREQNRAIREWAEQQGKQVSPRGRIPQAIVDQFHQTHPA
jgi:Ni,Fe-hydrogenase maturation factor